ncbi:MAG TPA: DUF4114 domain-containing protein [Vulgatibacter sp.]|nr:DUF4114 domain-containing protein [Vulgatibacter sp.]
MEIRPAFLPIVAVALVVVAAEAKGLTQPGSTKPIPEGSNLVNYLNQEGESIDPLTQAATTPRTFNPRCNLTFKVIARGGGQKNSFGWYNVTGSKPERSDLHEFLGCNDGEGVERELDIANHPAYRGGEIGFFMATTQGRGPDGKPTGGYAGGKNCVEFVEGQGPVDSTLGFLYYSEPQWNDDNQGEDSYIHLLIMDSGAYPQAFYFAWEDLYGGGDNDFEDLLTRVEGITCSGGGADCDTGRPGICAAGTMQCRDGKLACVQQTQAKAAEACNGMDDDCNGLVDDGATCPGADEVCVRGACVPKCFRGEFSCFDGLVCDDGVCVEPECEGVRCDAGEICVAGTCKAPCDGVLCPLGTICRMGSCIDPCEGVDCDARQLCDQGVCKAPCGCEPCPDGTVCDGSGLCVPELCAGVSCEAGFVCSGGVCVDACQGAVCPEGERCEVGACVPDTGAGGGGPGKGGAGGHSGGGGAGAGGAGGVGGIGAGGTGEARGPLEDGGSGGCGCASADGAGLGLLALGLLFARRGRRA